MNRKAELKLQGMLIGLLFVGLFIGFVTASISMMGGGYDTTGAELDELDLYNQNTNLSAKIIEAGDVVDTTTVDKNLFDYIAGIFSVLIAPLTFVYRSYVTMQNLVVLAAANLQIMPILVNFATTAIVVLVLIGIVMIKFYLGRQK